MLNGGFGILHTFRLSERALLVSHLLPNTINFKNIRNYWSWSSSSNETHLWILLFGSISMSLGELPNNFPRKENLSISCCNICSFSPNHAIPGGNITGNTIFHDNHLNVCWFHDGFGFSAGEKNLGQWEQPTATRWLQYHWIYIRNLTSHFIFVVINFF